jgi:hypothetical protein
MTRGFRIPRWVLGGVGGGARFHHGLGDSACSAFVVRGHAPTTSWKEGGGRVCQPRSGFRGSRSREVGGSAVVVERMGAGAAGEMEPEHMFGGAGDGGRDCFIMGTAQGQLGEKNIIPAALKLRTRI